MERPRVAFWLRSPTNSDYRCISSALARPWKIWCHLPRMILRARLSVWNHKPEETHDGKETAQSRPQAGARYWTVGAVLRGQFKIWNLRCDRCIHGGDSGCTCRLLRIDTTPGCHAVGYRGDRAGVRRVDAGPARRVVH